MRRASRRGDAFGFTCFTVRLVVRYDSESRLRLIRPRRTALLGERDAVRRATARSNRWGTPAAPDPSARPAVRRLPCPRVPSARAPRERAARLISCPNPPRPTCPSRTNTRTIEASVVTDFSDRMSYGGYLDLPTLLGGAAADLAARAPRRAAVHHPAPDHRALAEARAARARDRARPAARRRARPRAEVRRPREAHPEDADRAVVGARDAHAHRVRASSAACSATPAGSSRTSTAPSSSCSATRTRR